MTGNFRLLIVEDNPADADLLLRTLRRAGIGVDEFRVVDSPEAFHEALLSDKWDAVLSDYNLPGFDAMRSLSILRETGRRIPFLLVSGAVGEEKAADAVRSGAAGFVSKGHLDRLPLLLLRAIVEAAAERREDAARRAAEQAIAEQKHLLSIVSHDVRAPLQAFRYGMAQVEKLALGSGTAEELRNCFQQLNRTVDRMSRLVDDVLDYSKLDAGVFEIDRTPCDLRDVVKSMTDETRVLAQERDIPVVLEMPRRPVEIVFDDHRIEQVIANLLSNALKYSPPGGTLLIRMVESASDVCVEVLDEGPGIAAEDIPHLFQRYWQSTRSRGGGVGLGLYIAERLVALHGGRIWAENRSEGGAAFRFSLPREVTSEERNGIREGALVALVDDDAYSREILRGLLLDEGFRVNDWGSATAAMADLRADSETPEAAVVDARLPDVPGVQLAMALVSGTEFAPIARVVLISADPQAATNAPPGIRFLPKPIDLERLLVELRGSDRIRVPPPSLLKSPVFAVPER